MANGEEIHNEITGAVRGNVLQIGNVHGDVVAWQQPSSAPGPKDSLHEPLWRLAREVRETSTEVVRTWGITSSDALPVRWRTATDLVDHWETIHDSTEPAALDGQFTAVRETYHAVSSQRLVIVGQAGAGKTVLAHRLILDLLDTDNATVPVPVPVPVLFSLGDWNPTTTDLQQWMIQQLARDFGFLNSNNPATGETQADVLVQEKLILPVLDGFDEIGHQHHRAAIRTISNSDSPLVVTSRPEEYREAAHAVKAVGRAAAIELQDISPHEARRFLRLSTSKPRSREWDTVFDQIDTQPGQIASKNLTRVLRTPLMVTLIRTIYNDTADHHPGELLDTGRFPTTEALEDHLLEAYLDTTYPSHDTSPRGTHWDPDRARHWLGYLATHLQHRNTHDLTWWHLPTTLHRHTRILVTTATAMFMFAVVGGLMIWPTTGSASTGVLVLQLALALGLALGLSSEVGFFRGHTRREPERLRLGLPRRHRELRHRPTYFKKFTYEFISGLVPGLAIGIALGVMAASVSRSFSELAGSLGIGLGVGLAIGIVLGIANVVVSALGDTYDPHTTDPWTLLTRDRQVTLVRTTTTTVLAFGLVGGIGIAAGETNESATAFLLGVGVGLLAGIVRLAFSAWGNWLLFARLWLPLTGRLPWRPKRFLEDTYDRGVLRTTGAVYQFRHARLRDHLAKHYRT